MAKILCVALGLALCIAMVSAQRSPIADIVLSVMDRNVDPCVDFYNYSCGGWMAKNPIPGDKSRIDRSFEAITDRNMAILLNITMNPKSGRVHDFFAACMDTAQIERDGVAPLLNLWNDLVEMPTLGTGLAKNLAVLFSNGISALYRFGTEVDSANPKKMIYSLSQGGLTLPSPSYYSDSSIYTAYVAHMQKMFSLAGADSSVAASVAAFEKSIAGITVPPDQLFDPFVTFNKMPWTELFTLSPNTHFDDLVNELNLQMSVQLTLDAPKFFKDLSAVLASTPTEVISSYMRWKILHWMAPRLPAAFVDENFAFFGGVLGGLSKPVPRTKTCMQATDNAMPELTGRLFAEVAFPPESKRAAIRIFDDILRAFETNSQKLEWMDPTTTRRALDKLSKILRLVGYPENPKNYTHYHFGNAYTKNQLVVNRDQFDEIMATAGQASDRLKWEMSADTVNAYYSPNLNEIVFPAGILQSPFFDITYPSPMNYGGIGMVGGHEVTHSLDSQGRSFNGEGALEDWWLPETSRQFQKRVDCIIEQYGHFSPLPGYFVNGNLTQGENIADAGGLKTAHTAYMMNFANEAPRPSIVPGLSNEQLLFVGYAQTWCSKLTPAAIKQRLLTDPHSPPRFRVNGAAINNPTFAKAFQCRPNTPMNPPKRCEIW